MKENVKISGKIVFVSNVQTSGNSRFINIWSDTKASKEIAQIFEDFKKDVKVVESNGQMNGSLQLGAVTMLPDGTLRITTGGTHATMSKVNDKFTCELRLAIAGETYNDKGDTYEKTGFRIENYSNERLTVLEAEIEDEIAVEELRKSILRKKGLLTKSTVKVQQPSDIE